MGLTSLELFIIDNLLKGGSSVYFSHHDEIVLKFKHVVDGEETVVNFCIPPLTSHIYWVIHRLLERIASASKEEFVITEIQLNRLGVVGSWKEGEDWEAFIAPIRAKQFDPYVRTQ